MSAIEGKTRESATELVYALVRDSILQLELLPGAMIDRAELCERFGVSRSPISEALARLQSDGLVEILPQRGTRVARIRMADLNQAMFIRQALEVEAVRTVAQSITGAILAKLSLNLQFQAVAARNEQTDEFVAFDIAFHNIIIDQLGYPKVKYTIETAGSNLHRARRLLSTPGASPDQASVSPVRQLDTIQQHEAILQGLRDHDPPAAAAAMKRHLDITLDGFLRLARRNKEVVAD